jgi:sugar lactone lactonase YvrE
MKLSTLLAVLATVTLAATTSFADPSSPTYQIERLVPGSDFLGVHGLAFDANDVLYAGSVFGETIYRVDTASGKVTPVIGPPQGMADDLVFLADGTLVWTAISQGVVRSRKGTGLIRDIAKLASVNSVNVRKDGRLFVGQVFGGDGIWELDPSGKKAPRSIVPSPGGFNGFDIGPDGMLYGPLWFKKQIVQVNPDTGALKVIADGFDTPAAANFDSKGNLYALDTARGEVVLVDIKSGARKVVAKLSTSLDNLAIDSHDRIFVSNMADNGIQEVDPETGAVRQVVKGKLAAPQSIVAVSDGGKDTLYVADVFAFRSIDGATGAVTDIARSHAANTPIEYAQAVTATAEHLVLTNNGGLIDVFDRKTKAVLMAWHSIRGVINAAEVGEGTLVLALNRGQSGALVLASGKDGADRQDIATDLKGPVGLATIGNLVFASEADAGRIIAINLETSAKYVVAIDLARPQGIAAGPDGMIYVAEADAKRLTRVEPKTGNKTVIATDLPFGRPNLRVTTVGVAAGANGVLYVTSDRENSVWKLTPKAK